MSTEAQVTAPELAGPSRVQRAWRGFIRFNRKNPLGAIGGFMVLLVIVIAVFEPLFIRYDPLWTVFEDRLVAPGLAHFFGTDEFGRDLWARVVSGSRISTVVGFVSVAAGTSIGLVVGLVAGYFGGRTDTLFSRGIDVMLAFPGFLTALALMATLGTGLVNVIIAISIGFIPRTARTMRSTVLPVKENQYIDAARALGASSFRIIFRHVFPNVIPPYLIIASRLLSSAILIEASLSFLGLGIPPPFPSWGRMLSSSVANYAMTAPWMVLFPGLAITWLVLGFNLFGDALRDVLDPRLRGSQ